MFFTYSATTAPVSKALLGEVMEMEGHRVAGVATELSQVQ